MVVIIASVFSAWFFIRLPISSNNEINVEDINAKLSGSSNKEIDSNRLSNDYRDFLSKRRNDLFNERNHKRKEEKPQTMEHCIEIS